MTVRHRWAATAAALLTGAFLVGVGATPAYAEAASLNT
jgi:hypothetical protein